MRSSTCQTPQFINSTIIHYAIINKMGKETSLFLVSWETNWSPLWDDDRIQLILLAGGSPPRAARSRYLVGSGPHRAMRLCSQMRGPVPITQARSGKPSRNNLQQLTLGTRKQSFWRLYLPPEQTWCMAFGNSFRLLCLQFSNLQHTLRCYGTFYSTFRKGFRSVSNLHFNPSKTGSTARSPWDWEVK